MRRAERPPAGPSGSPPARRRPKARRRICSRSCQPNLYPWFRPASFFEPHIAEILADVVARRHVPALEFFRGDDDAVPPQKRNRIGVGQRVPLEVADDLRALLRISTDRLTDIERVEKAIGRAGMVDRREVAGNVSRELYRRIVEII